MATLNRFGIGLALTLAAGSYAALQACSGMGPASFVRVTTEAPGAPATAAGGPPTPAAAPASTPMFVAGRPGTGGEYGIVIHGKRMYNLSRDLKTITLSVEASEPDGAALDVEWAQDSGVGVLSTSRGKDTQWSVQKDGTYTVTVTATVKRVRKPDEAAKALFQIPVVDGKVQAPEIAPELVVFPQSLVLFRPLPATLADSVEALKALGVRTRAQLIATTYIYDRRTNEKLKVTGNQAETWWDTGDPNLAIVDDSGLIQAADGSATGSTVVSVLSKTNSSSRAAARVQIRYLDTRIALRYATTTVYIPGQGVPNSINLGATVHYTNPLDRDRVVYADEQGRELTWSSSDPSIAQVDSRGVVTPLADAQPGIVTVTARSNYDPGSVAKVEIRVKGNPLMPVNLGARFVY